MVYPLQTVTHTSTNPAVHGWQLNLQPVDHKSDALTTTPRIHVVVVFRYNLLSLLGHLFGRQEGHQACKKTPTSTSHKSFVFEDHVDVDK